MSEHEPISPERIPSQIELDPAERKSSKEHELSTDKHDSKEHLDKLRQHIESQSVASKEVPVWEKEKPAHQPTTVNRAMKKDSYNRSLKTIRSKLGSGDRLASRVIHQPLVDRLSSIGATTVARPSGILGGSIGALIGSIALLLMTKHYGITYNYLLIFPFFGLGFAVGLLFEVVVRIFKPRRQN